jgi:hypothetical protein
MSSLEQLIAATPHRKAEEVLAHPRFAEARKLFVDGTMRLYEGDARLNRLILEAGRLMLFGYVVCLHARYVEADRATWPTISRLKEIVAPFQAASDRQMDEIIARLVDRGFLQISPAPGDRRVRLLIPTEVLYAHHRELLAAQFQPLQFMYPDPSYAAPTSRDPAYHKAHCAKSLTALPWSAKFLAANAPVMLFFSRHAGIAILVKLIQMMNESGASSGLSHADIGLRFGVSRTHVRALMSEAQSLGLTRLAGRGGRLVHLTPPLLAAFDRLFADSMAVLDLIHALTLSVREPTLEAAAV